MGLRRPRRRRCYRATLNADPGNVWRYNLSEDNHNARNSRAAFGRIIAPDHRAALRQIAAVLGQGHPPATVERGLFDTMATEPPTYGEPDAAYPAR